jgi:lipopolysaccharide transport system ATP-binding protein
MTVRLAFAVAAFLEPEILVVDEVLAVGDAEFQKKAIGKMQDISKEGGRTVLFVSHNMAAVKSLCTRGILMNNGTIAFMGNIDQTLEYYLSSNLKFGNQSRMTYEKDLKKQAQVLQIMLKDENDEQREEFFTNQSINIHITVFNTIVDNNLRLNFSILDKFENLLFINRKKIDFQGTRELIIKIPKDILIANHYFIGLAIDVPKVKLYDLPTDKVRLNIINVNQEEFNQGDIENGIFKMLIQWN